MHFAGSDANSFLHSMQKIPIQFHRFEFYSFAISHTFDGVV